MDRVVVVAAGGPFQAGLADKLEELAVDLWKDAQLRAMPPEDAAAIWLSPVKVQEDTSAKNTAC